MASAARTRKSSSSWSHILRRNPRHRRHLRAADGPRKKPHPELPEIKRRRNAGASPRTRWPAQLRPLRQRLRLKRRALHRQRRLRGRLHRQPSRKALRRCRRRRLCRQNRRPSQLLKSRQRRRLRQRKKLLLQRRQNANRVPIHESEQRCRPRYCWVDLPLCDEYMGCRLAGRLGSLLPQKQNRYFTGRHEIKVYGAFHRYLSGYSRRSLYNCHICDTITTAIIIICSWCDGSLSARLLPESFFPPPILRPSSITISSKPARLLGPWGSWGRLPLR